MMSTPAPADGLLDEAALVQLQTYLLKARRRLAVAEALCKWGPDFVPEIAWYLHDGWYALDCALATSTGAAPPGTADLSHYGLTSQASAIPIGELAEQALDASPLPAVRLPLGSLQAEVKRLKSAVREVRTRLQRVQRRPLARRARRVLAKLVEHPIVAIAGATVVLAAAYQIFFSHPETALFNQGPAGVSLSAEPPAVHFAYLGDEADARNLGGTLVDVGSPTAKGLVPPGAAGWSSAEKSPEGETFVWGQFPQSSLDLPLKSGVAYELVLVVTVSDPAAAARSVEVSLDDKPLALTPLPRAGAAIRLILPADRVREQNHLGLRWVGNGKPGEKAARLYALAFRPVTNPAPSPFPVPGGQFVVPSGVVRDPAPFEATLVPMGDLVTRRILRLDDREWKSGTDVKTGLSFVESRGPLGSFQVTLEPHTSYDLTLTCAADSRRSVSVLLNEKPVGGGELASGMHVLTVPLAAALVTEDNQIALTSSPPGVRLFTVALRRTSASDGAQP